MRCNIKTILLPKVRKYVNEIRNNLTACVSGCTVGCILNTPFGTVKSRIQSDGTI